MENVKDKNNEKGLESANALDSNDIFSAFDNSNEDTSSIFNAIMSSEISDEDSSFKDAETEAPKSKSTSNTSDSVNSDEPIPTEKQDKKQDDGSVDVQDEAQKSVIHDTESQVTPQKNETLFSDNFFADFKGDKESVSLDESTNLEESTDTDKIITKEELAGPVELKKKEEATDNNASDEGWNSFFSSNPPSDTTGTAGLDDDPFGEALFTDTQQGKAGIDSDNPFAGLETQDATAAIEDGNPFADMGNDVLGGKSTASDEGDGNPFSEDYSSLQDEKTDRSNNSPVSNNDQSIFDDLSSPFASNGEKSDQDDISIDEFLKSIS